MNVNHTPQSMPNGTRKIATAFMLIAAFCFAESMVAANIGYEIYTAAKQIPFNQAVFDQKIADLHANVNTQDANGGATALHWAINYNAKGAIEVLLRQNGINLELANAGGNTPLMIAIAKQNPIIVDLLIKRGANAETINPNNGQTALHVAALKNIKSIQIALALIAENADINSIDADGNTPLHIAAKNGNVHICQLLIVEGANKNAINNSGETPLNLANNALATLPNINQDVMLEPPLFQQSQRMANLKKIIELLTPPTPPSMLQTFWETLRGLGR